MAAKVRRVVTVDAEANASVQELSYRQLRDFGYATKEDIAQWTDCEHRALLCHSLQQCRVFCQTNTMVDALDIKTVERNLDILRRTFFASMSCSFYPKSLRL